MSGQYLHQEIIISQIMGLQQKTIALILYHGQLQKTGCDKAKKQHSIFSCLFIALWQPRINGENLQSIYVIVLRILFPLNLYKKPQNFNWFYCQPKSHVLFVYNTIQRNKSSSDCFTALLTKGMFLKFPRLRIITNLGSFFRIA